MGGQVQHVRHLCARVEDCVRALDGVAAHHAATAAVLAAADGLFSAARGDTVAWLSRGDATRARRVDDARHGTAVGWLLYRGSRHARLLPRVRAVALSHTAGRRDVRRIRQRCRTRATAVYQRERTCRRDFVMRVI
jgi:hypothetical protein